MPNTSLEPAPDIILNLESARAMAKQWADAWNARDLEGILSHYSDSVVFYSPAVITRYGEPSGCLKGKEALRKHFQRGLDSFGGNIQFNILDVLAGVNGYTVYYSRETGATAVDTVIVDADGKAVQVHAHYHAA